MGPVPISSSPNHAHRPHLPLARRAVCTSQPVVLLEGSWCTSRAQLLLEIKTIVSRPTRGDYRGWGSRDVGTEGGGLRGPRVVGSGLPLGRPVGGIVASGTYSACMICALVSRWQKLPSWSWETVAAGIGPGYSGKRRPDCGQGRHIG